MLLGTSISRMLEMLENCPAKNNPGYGGALIHMKIQIVRIIILIK